MANNPLVVLVDDHTAVHEVFFDIIDDHALRLETFETWDKAKEYIEGNPNHVDALILDAKGKLRSDEQESDNHLTEAIGWVREQKGKGRIIPYAIYTAHADTLSAFTQERKAGRMFSKPDGGKDVLAYLKGEIANTEKYHIINQHPEPFACFGGCYLDTKYETYLLDIIKTLHSTRLSNPQDLLFNPCRILLEQVFRKINEVDESMMPYAFLGFENQRPNLTFCSLFLSGKKDCNGKGIPSHKKPNAFIAHQIHTIVTFTQPASHELQGYTQYTFNSVLYALFDVLIWLKTFIDKNQH